MHAVRTICYNSCYSALVTHPLDLSWVSAWTTKPVRGRASQCVRQHSALFLKLPGAGSQVWDFNIRSPEFDGSHAATRLKIAGWRAHLMSLHQLPACLGCSSRSMCSCMSRLTRTAGPALSWNAVLLYTVRMTGSCRGRGRSRL